MLPSWRVRWLLSDVFPGSALTAAGLKRDEMDVLKRAHASSESHDQETPLIGRRTEPTLDAYPRIKSIDYTQLGRRCDQTVRQP